MNLFGDTGLNFKNVFVRNFTAKMFGAAELNVINEYNSCIFLISGEMSARINSRIEVNQNSEFYVVSQNACVIIVDGDCVMIQFKDQFELNILVEYIHKNKKLKMGILTERTDTASATQYFQSYGYLAQQQNMLQDISINTFKEAFIKNHNMFKDKVVLDVGIGCGMLSFFAVHAGARLVYAIKPDPIARHSKLLVIGNTMENKIKLLTGRLSEIKLNEQVDVIVSEPFGLMLFDERNLDIFLFSKKWLKPGGIMFPSRGDLHIAPFMDDIFYLDILKKAGFWDRKYFNVDLRSIKDAALKEYIQQPIVGSFDLSICLSKSIRYSVDFATAKERDLFQIQIPLFFEILEPGTVHGLAFWFEAAFVGENATVWLSTSPTKPLTQWYQVRCLLESPLTAKAGQHLIGSVLLTVNEEKSYNISIELAIEGIDNANSSNFLNLNNAVFDYSCLTPAVPAVNTMSPSEAYWNQLDQLEAFKRAAHVTPENADAEMPLDLSMKPNTSTCTME